MIRTDVLGTLVRRLLPAAILLLPVVLAACGNGGPRY